MTAVNSYLISVPGNGCCKKKMNTADSVQSPRHWLYNFDRLEMMGCFFSVYACYELDKHQKLSKI